MFYRTKNLYMRVPKSQNPCFRDFTVKKISIWFFVMVAFQILKNSYDCVFMVEKICMVVFLWSRFKILKILMVVFQKRKMPYGCVLMVENKKNLKTLMVVLYG